MYVYIAVHLKLTQHCKSTILQYKIKKFLNVKKKKEKEKERDKEKKKKKQTGLSHAA